jgi:hypothetical protein
MKRLGMLLTAILLQCSVVACQSASVLPGAAGATEATAAWSTSIAASTRSSRRPVLADPEKMSAGPAVFSKPDVPDRAGPPTRSWLLVADDNSIVVFDAKSFHVISTCSCGGGPIAVNPTTYDMAGTLSNSKIGVWHVNANAITQFATLTLSQDDTEYPEAIAYDEKGDLYSTHGVDNYIDFFSAAEIQAGGGSPSRTFRANDLVRAYAMAIHGKHMALGGDLGASGTVLIDSIDLSNGSEQIEQALNGPYFAGMVLDRHNTLLLNLIGYPNNIDGSLVAFAYPWSGSPSQAWEYSDGDDYEVYNGISLNKKQDEVYSTAYDSPYISEYYGYVSSSTYPTLGGGGGSSRAVEYAGYGSIAVDPQ